MWQDGLALLIVVVAVLALLRLYLPSRLFRFGARRGDDGSAQNAPPTSGCSGCASGSSCAKVQVKVYPVAVGPGKRKELPT
jgi:hypothetical protein